MMSTVWYKFSNTDALQWYRVTGVSAGDVDALVRARNVYDMVVADVGGAGSVVLAGTAVVVLLAWP